MKRLIDNNKKIRLIESFSGIGAQAMALERMGVPFEHYRAIEFDKYQMAGYNAIHGTNFETSDIRDIHIDDLGIVDKAHYQYIMTYSFPCFLGTTMITTINGNKPIKDIKVGDMVLTHDGTYQKVISSQCTGKKEVWRIEPLVSNLLYGDVIYNKLSNRETWCTPNHRFYVKNIKTNKITFEQIQNIYNDGLSNYKFAEILGDSTEIQWNNIRSIAQMHYEDLVYDITVEKNHSFVANGFVVHNCQDLSLAGKQAGMEKGSGTRSSLLFEVGRILQEGRDKAIQEGVDSTIYLPGVLILENVTQIHNKKNLDSFTKWLNQLDNLGYTTKWADMNAKDFGIPQNRLRCFCVSWLDCEADFEFPEPIDLKYAMEDCLQPESEIPEKQYIQWPRARKLIEQMIDKYGDELEELV